MLKRRRVSTGMLLITLKSDGVRLLVCVNRLIPLLIMNPICESLWTGVGRSFRRQYWEK